MKILHIFNELKFSGAEIMYVDAAEEFQKSGCELYAVNTAENLGEYKEAFQNAGYKVLYFPMPSKFSKKLGYYKKLFSFIKKEGIEVIHIHRANIKWGMALIAKLAGIKSIYTIHNCFRNPALTRPYQIWLRWSAKNLLGCKFQSISDSVERNELDFYHNKTSKIYNWYGNKRFYPASENEKKDIRKRLDIPESSLVIISVGGCSYIKRHEDIIKLLPELIKKYPDLVYLHLGSGETIEDEKKLAEELGIDSNIRFYGNQNNVRDFLVASDYYLMPSRFEGIPLTTIEAMACKIPSILYDVPGLRDFNSEAECAYIVKESPTEMSKAIDFLEENPKIKNQMIEYAFNFINQKFYLPANVKKIFNLYKS